jgi:hypothetical protein
MAFQTCEYCGEEFDTKPEWIEYMKKKHGGEIMPLDMIGGMKW